MTTSLGEEEASDCLLLSPCFIVYSFPAVPLGTRKGLQSLVVALIGDFFN